MRIKFLNTEIDNITMNEAVNKIDYFIKRQISHCLRLVTVKK